MGFHQQLQKIRKERTAKEHREKGSLDTPAQNECEWNDQAMELLLLLLLLLLPQSSQFFARGGTDVYISLRRGAGRGEFAMTDSWRSGALLLG